MEIQKLTTSKGSQINGPLIIKPNIFSDKRGYFFESWNKKSFNNEISNEVQFVQDNHAKSSKGVLRGLHFQRPPQPQGKLIRCTLGKIFDVAVDLRRSSKTYLEWIGIELNEANKKQLWIPAGFAHGYLTISNYAEVQYKATAYWNQRLESTLLWNDRTVNIDWKLKTNNIIEPLISEKDNKGLTFDEIDKKGDYFQ